MSFHVGTLLSWRVVQTRDPNLPGFWYVCLCVCVHVEERDGSWGKMLMESMVEKHNL